MHDVDLSAIFPLERLLRRWPRAGAALITIALLALYGLAGALDGGAL